jgi:hypothetical protein
MIFGFGGSVCSLEVFVLLMRQWYCLYLLNQSVSLPAYFQMHVSALAYDKMSVTGI